MSQTKNVLRVLAAFWNIVYYLSVGLYIHNEYNIYWWWYPMSWILPYGQRKKYAIKLHRMLSMPFKEQQWEINLSFLLLWRYRGELTFCLHSKTCEEMRVTSDLCGTRCSWGTAVHIPHRPLWLWSSVGSVQRALWKWQSTSGSYDPGGLLLSLQGQAERAPMRLWGGEEVTTVIQTMRRIVDRQVSGLCIGSQQGWGWGSGRN